MVIRNPKGNPATLTSFKVECPLIIPGDRLSKKMTAIRLQLKAEDALNKIPPKERPAFLRKCITEALAKNGLLDLPGQE